MSELILTLNGGSSSLKVALYPAASGDARMRGQVERIGSAPRLSLAWSDGARVSYDLRRAGGGHRAALDAVLSEVEAHSPGDHVIAAAHRVVHGGPERDGSVRLSARTLADLARLSPYAPLHQPHNLAAVRAAMAAFPKALQIAAFDTSFHRHHPWVADTFALPHRFYAKGVRRYGFHGLSYDSIAAWLAEKQPKLHAGRVIVAHLGNGASMCAMRRGESIASTMGFSAMDGLPMGTRSGQIDPGVILYLLDEEGMDTKSVTELLYKKSGLLGLSGLSNDMRVLEQAGTPDAEAAIAYFVHRIRREIGALTAALGGLDALIFTGGIGENSRRIRAEACTGMAWLGLEMNPQKNAGGGPELSTSTSQVWIGAVPTDEEGVLVREARAHLGRDRA